MPKKSYFSILDEHLHILVTEGCHEALERLQKRYRFHAANLCRDLLNQYMRTGIRVRELMQLCDNSFLYIVRNYDSGLNSFFSYWKEYTLHKIMEYMINNSYITNLEAIQGLSLEDQEKENERRFSAFLLEKDDVRVKKRKAFEIKNFIFKHERSFSSQESTLLNFVLDGFSLRELEHVGLISRSKLYLTFNAAIDKLKNLIKQIRGNKK